MPSCRCCIPVGGPILAETVPVGYEANWGPAIIAVGYGIGLLVIARSKVLEYVVPKDIADQVRRAQRRAARRQDEEE